MLKYSFILLVAYFLYYAGNIVYDLFLKKEKEIQTDVAEEFSLADFGQTDHQPPSQVRIEDVEHIKTPNSFIKKELPSQKQTSFEENPSLDELRRRFEAEQDIDEIFPNQNKSEKEAEKENEESSDKETIPNQDINETDENSKRKEIVKKENQWKNFLNLAETTVQMVANLEGHKVYHSIM